MSRSGELPIDRGRGPAELTADKRRLAAILIADVVGYSRLMHEDDGGTLTALTAHRRELIVPSIASHDGRLVNMVGDSLLAEFGSVAQALSCAMEIQRHMQERNGAIPPYRRIQFRIGISVGEVIDRGGEIFGTGVNMAARLESVAKPGGICISEETYRQVRNRPNLRFDDMGTVPLKNLGPVRVFRVSDLRDAAPPLAAPNIPARSSDAKPGIGIAVMPFGNLSGDPDQEFFCDGLANDLITDLSRFRELLVIAANSSFAYKGRVRKVQEVATELGASYLLEGSVQRLSNRVRVNAQLIEGATGHHLWVDRFEKDISELFQLQDEIIRRIVGSLPGRLRELEGQRALRKDPVEICAYEAYLRGVYLYSIETEEALDRCREQFEQAVRLDSSFARAWGYLAYTAVQSWIAGWADAGQLEQAEAHARLGVSLDPNDYATHWDLAFVYLNTCRFELALEEYKKAVALNPNDADLLSEMAEMLVFAGEPDRALEQLREAMLRNPFHPDWYCWVLAWALFNVERYEESLAELDRMNRPPQHVDLLRAAIQIKRGDVPKAEAALGRFLTARPGWTIAKERIRCTFQRPEDEQRWLGALADVGLPRE